MYDMKNYIAWFWVLQFRFMAKIIFNAKLDFLVNFITLILMYFLDWICTKETSDEIF